MVFFFKQKTAYEIRIRDWSSDVCSSDLASSLMPGVLQSLAPPALRSRVLALLGIVNALALAASPLAIGAISGLIAGPRGMLLAITIVSLPSLIASAVLLGLAPKPYAATLRAIRPHYSEETP